MSVRHLVSQLAKHLAQLEIRAVRIQTSNFAVAFCHRYNDFTIKELEISSGSH